MSTLTMLGIGLTAVFAVSLGALVAQIAWVLWRRDRYLRDDCGCSRGDVEGGPVTATKELFYFFCWKDSQSSTRVEPDCGNSDRGAATGDGLEDDDEVMKWHAMYRESRMLCTIKEEDKEGESDRDGDGGGLAASEPETEEKKMKERRVCLRECLEVKQESLDRETVVVVVSTLEGLSASEPMPFLTPCGSPDRYFTPLPSPVRAELNESEEEARYAEMASHC